MNRAFFVGIFLFGFVLATTRTVSAQSVAPRVEVFGGGSYLPADGDDFPRRDSGGFQSSITFNVNRWFGVVGDFGGHYTGEPESTSVYEYLVGPRFTKRNTKMNVFGHVLIGGARGATSRIGFSDNELAFGGGGGLDIHVNDRIAIRAVQVDYVGSFVEILENNYRVGVGVVFKF